MANMNSKNSIRIRISHEKGGEQVFKAIITHPMETGYRRDNQSGTTIPADYIEDVLIKVEGKTCFATTLSENVSMNPFLSFVFTKPLIDNQNMTISWMDNNKRDISYDCVVKFGQDGKFNFAGEKAGSAIYQPLPDAGPACKIKIPLVAK